MTHPLAFRERIVRAYLNGEGTQTELAARFFVDKETVGRLVRQYRSTVSLAPSPAPRGRKDTLRGEALEHLKALVEEDDTRFLHELVQLLQDRHNIQTSPSAVSRVLIKHRTSRKKTFRATEGDRVEVLAKREAFQKTIRQADPASLVFIDETVSHKAQCREVSV